MAKRQTIGDNPLDAYISPQSSSNVEVVEELEKNVAIKKGNSSKKQRITVQISEEVIDRVKNSVYWTPGLTLASLAEEAFAKAVNELENQRGEPFPKRKDELKTGRPLS
jgi:hypothetical protein